MSCTMDGIILDDPSLGIGGGPAVKCFAVEHRDEVGVAVRSTRLRFATGCMNGGQLLPVYEPEREEQGKSYQTSEANAYESLFMHSVHTFLP